MTNEIRQKAELVEKKIAPQFEEIMRISKINTEKVMDAFRKFRVSETLFAGTSGYGYDDHGRDTLDKIFAKIFGAESALVRLGMVNGTHAIACSLFAVAEPNKKLVSISGMPYDTIMSTIGTKNDCYGSLKYYGVDFSYVDLKTDGSPDFEAIKTAVSDPTVGAVMIQRSRGYSTRRAINVSEIAEMIKTVREINPEIAIFVDNCYGEFVEEHEPSEFDADLIAGSLIKNPGGGIAPTGGYIAGKEKYVERAAVRLTTAGIGGECGSTLGNNGLLYRGLFMAPHTVAEAMKTAVFCAGMLEEFGFETSPSVADHRSDIVQIVKLGNPENLLKFCKGIQFGAPVDSFVSPVAAPMPGYDDEVVMASGSFVQGSTIELSADGPMREPYYAFLQGGLTYESGRLGIMFAVDEMLNN